MGWVETPAPERATCVMASCGHAPAVAVFVPRAHPESYKALCVDHVVEVLKRQLDAARLMEIHEVRW